MGFFPENKWVYLPVIALELIMKGFALWKAAKKDHKYWFVALLVLNPVGVLPVIYLLFFADRARAETKPTRKSVGRKNK